ncbi:MAG: hypothetical protein HY514_01105 [Candidatus Aenigmarchaeota archaeon]|nr:hypothetical protein [Candidatus Aenigmarchaeota archaeon]
MENDQDVNYLVDLVKKNPGKYPAVGLVKEFRLYKMQSGSDPGLPASYRVIHEAMRRGGIAIRDRTVGLNSVQRFYPSDVFPE